MSKNSKNFGQFEVVLPIGAVPEYTTVTIKGKEVSKATFYGYIKGRDGAMNFEVLGDLAEEMEEVIQDKVLMSIEGSFYPDTYVNKRGDKVSTVKWMAQYIAIWDNETKGFNIKLGESRRERYERIKAEKEEEMKEEMDEKPVVEMTDDIADEEMDAEDFF